VGKDQNVFDGVNDNFFKNRHISKPPHHCALEGGWQIRLLFWYTGSG